MMSRFQRRSRAACGFTLLELLVALAIFGVMASIAFGGLRQIVKAQDVLAPRYSRLSELQFALAVLESDLQYAAPRSTRDPLGGELPCVRAGIEGSLLEVTRYLDGYAWDAARPGVQRVSYSITDRALYRETWPAPDVTQSTHPSRRLLLAGVDKLSVRFMGGASGGRQWAEVWPADESSAQADTLPVAVEFTLRFRDGTSLRRVVLPFAGGA